tara:strand:- start:899 stop:1708 length:810 start_codon:yes stop_codon:yes gene_type:complete
MRKKGNRGFRMKGFSPFTAKSSSPMRETEEDEAYDSSVADYDNDGRVSNNEHRRYMESMRGSVNPGERSISSRASRGSYYDPKSVPAYHKSQTPVDDLTARERRLIEQAGGFDAGINPELMRGLDPGTHEGRRRVSRLNAYHEFHNQLAKGNIQSPEQYKREYHQYQEKLSAMLDPKSTTNRISEYDNYDEFGRPHKEKIEEYKKHKRRAIGIDEKTGRYILPGPDMTKEEAEEARLKFQYPELYKKREADREASKKRNKNKKKRREGY